MANKTISFVTGNLGKVAALQNRLGDSAQIERVALDIPEIQADTAEEIAIYKARYAFEQIRKPLIMQDSAFHIRALNGFPGPYIKFVNETVGPEGLLSLMKDKEDRYCYFELVAVYIDGNGKEYIFRNDDIRGGQLARHRYEANNDKAWSVLWQIYIPHWASLPLAALSKEEIDDHERKNDKHSEMYYFAQWYKAQSKDAAT